MKNGTVPITPGQMKDLASALTQAIPSDMPSKLAQELIRNKGTLQKAVREVLMSEEWLPIPEPQKQSPEPETSQKQPDVPKAKRCKECLHDLSQVQVNRFCPICSDKLPEDICLGCHKALKHGLLVPREAIEKLIKESEDVVLGRKNTLGSIDNDPDAFGRADLD